jgi:hypothetical protein
LKRHSFTYSHTQNTTSIRKSTGAQTSQSAEPGAFKTSVRSLQIIISDFGTIIDCFPQIIVTRSIIPTAGGLNIESNHNLRFRMLRFLVFLPIRCSSVDASCGKTGFQRVNEYWWSDRDNWQNHDQAFVSFSGWPDLHYLGIKGSYIAQQEGTHYFRVYRDYFTGSVSLANCDYATEWVSRTLEGGQGTLWEDGPQTFHRYYRYRIFCRYREGQHKANSQLELQIKTPGAGDYVIMSASNGGRACEESGCEDTSLSRTEWSCQPAPSPSQSPSATPSLAFVPSIALRQSPLLRESRHLPNSELYATDDHRKSATLTESSVLADSSEFNESERLPHSGGLPPSDYFDGSDRLNGSEQFTDSEEAIPSDFPARSPHLIHSGLLRATAPLAPSQSAIQSSHFGASLGRSKSSRFAWTAALGDSREIAPSGSFVETDRVQGPSLQRASPGFGVAGSLLSVFVVIAVVVLLILFIWKRNPQSEVADETEMVVDGQSTEQTTEFMSTLEDEFMVATQYQTEADGVDAFPSLAGGDALQEAIFAF